MSTTTVVRYRQTNKSVRPVTTLDLNAIKRKVREATTGGYGQTDAFPEIVQIKVPPANYLSINVVTERPVTDAAAFARMINGAINTAGQGEWSFSPLPGGAVPSAPRTTGSQSAPIAGAAPPGGSGTVIDTAAPPRHGQRPFPQTRNVLSMGTVASTNPARNGMTAREADAAVPADSPRNDITVAGVLPIVAIGVGGALVGGLVYWLVRRYA